MGVVGHDDAAKEDGHDARQMEAFREGIGQVSEAEHHAELQRWVPPQLDVLE